MDLVFLDLCEFNDKNHEKLRLANAVAAGDLGFEVTFFCVTSANLEPKSCFLGYFWIFVNFAVLSNFRKMAISRDLGRVRRRA